MTKACIDTRLSVRRLVGPSWTALLICICYLPMLAVATYESDVQVAAELWVDITHQDYLYLNGTISKEEWIKEQSDFRRSFQHIKGNNPGKFEKDFAEAVAKILHLKNTQKAALVAIKAAPECYSVEEYRDDVWRGSRIQTKANEDGVYNTSNLGKQPRDSLTKAERDDLYYLANDKYGSAKNPVPIFQMFYRNYDMVFARDIVWSKVIPSASLNSDIKRKVPQRKGIRKRPDIDLPITSTCNVNSVCLLGEDADGDGHLDPDPKGDSDGDGLCDIWETEGIYLDEVDSNGSANTDVDYVLPEIDSNLNGIIDPEEKADPKHKDIFVEVDWMAKHKPYPKTLEAVKASFANAPSSVDNPDKKKGINLHIQLDEQAIAHNDVFALNKDPFALPDDYTNTKKDYFGTQAERDPTNTSQQQVDRRLKAKLMAFRYALFVHQFSVNGITQTLTTGLAETPGNDFLISLGVPGAWATSAPDLHAVGDISQQAGTFMHELGHTLNLRHGGGDDPQGEIGCKPNYLSVMNYAFQHYVRLYPNSLFDYSRKKLDKLDESKLDEAKGIGGHPDFQTRYGPDTLGFTNMMIVPSDQSIDWNQDGDKTDNPALLFFRPPDINDFDIPGCEGVGDILEGHDDWGNLLYLGSGGDYADGAHFVSTGQKEITTEDALKISPDLDEDGLKDFVDNCPLVPNITQDDVDDDSFGDACDVCPNVYDMGQKDSDGDGTGDACAVIDSDDDGILDDVDNCPYAAGLDVDTEGCVYSFSGLIDLVVKLVNEEVISEQMTNSLLSKVGNAESSFDRGNVCTAMHKLSAFKNQIDVQKGKKISADAATQLKGYSDNLSLYLLSQLPTGEICD